MNVFRATRLVPRTVFFIDRCATCYDVNGAIQSRGFPRLSMAAAEPYYISEGWVKGGGHGSPVGKVTGCDCDSVGLYKCRSHAPFLQGRRGRLQQLAGCRWILRMTSLMMHRPISHVVMNWLGSVVLTTAACNLTVSDVIAARHRRNQGWRSAASLRQSYPDIVL